MSRLMVVTTPDLVVGYQLAGVETFAAADSFQAEQTLRELIKEGEASLIAVHQDLLQGMDSRMRRQIESGLRPIVIAIPASRQDAALEARSRYITELIRRAIGIHISVGGNTTGTPQTDH